MKFDEYQREAAKTAIYPESARVAYPVLGLASEAGEVAGKLAKHMRDTTERAESYHAMLKELGDCLWMIAMASRDMGYSLETVAQVNLEKLRDRQQRGVLGGSGDNR